MSCSEHCSTVIDTPMRSLSNKLFFQKSSIFSKGLSLTLFVVCLSLNLLMGQNQTITTPVNGSISLNTLNNCASYARFISDTTIHYSLYADSTPRSDSTSICPNQGQRVKVTFSAFDLADGDTLFAYDGKIPSINNFIASGSGSGVGISKAFGGWINASCDPKVNPTGCMSFIFKTNGDNNQSTGFQAKITCEERNLQIVTPNIFTAPANCNRTYELVTIPAAEVTSNCDTIANDSTFVRVLNTSGKLCIDTCLSYNANMSFVDTFAFGTYVVRYKLKSDSSIQQQAFFSVKSPILTCNDTLNIGIDAICSVQITPDILLENPCPEIPDTFYYRIDIKVPDDKIAGGRIIASGTGRPDDTYPMITKDLIQFCGERLYTAQITQVYYDSLDLSFCNNGVQSNSCWSYLRFEDKTAPFFLERPQCDTIYACVIEMTPAALGMLPPTVTDNCDTVTVEFARVELLIPETKCDTINTYLATWRASDQCGNTSERQDTIKIFRPGIDKIIKVPNVYLSCGEDDTTAINDLARMGVPGIQIGRQVNGVFIPSDTIPLNEVDQICKYNIEKRDVRVTVECNDKYYRYWQLLDWCSQSTVPISIDTQLIEFKDTLAPIINCTEYSTIETAEKIGLSRNVCEMEINFPLPTATDNCVSNPKVIEFTVDVLESTGWWSVGTTLAEAGALACDTFRVGYRAFDGCHEQIKEDTCYRYFIIEDVAGPTAICEDELIVSLASGSTRIHADAIDGGSWDMCGIDTILARRTHCEDISTYQGDDNQYVTSKLGEQYDAKGWSDIIEFTCCDLHHAVFVELLVIDEKGNANTCWMEIKTEDKIRPICKPLPTQTAFCDDYHESELGSETDLNDNRTFDEREWVPLIDDLELFYNQEFGNPALSCEDNLVCNALMIEQEYQLVKQSCGEINIKRRYRVIDYGKNHSSWEEQIINLEYQANWKITFPVDLDGDCDTQFNEIAEVPFQNGNCDQLSWEYTDEFFESANDVFVKVLRTYSIINWCIYEPGDKPLIIRREENYRGVVQDPRMVCSDSLADVSYIQYTQIMKVVDEDAPFLFIGKVDTIIIGKGDVEPYGEEDNTLGSAPFECDAIKIFQVFARDCNEASSESLNYIWEFLMNGELITTGTGDTFSQIVYVGPDYEVKWIVTDPFTNTSLISEHYTFSDGLAPVAYCNSGIVAEQTPGNRFVYVDSDMFDRGSYDNCTDQANLKKRLWHPVLNIPRPQTAMEVMALPTFLEFGCLFIGTQDISFYVMDEGGNFDYCITKLIIQNNMLACSRRMVSGEIIDQKNRAIEDVEIIVESIENNLSILSNEEGNFEFTMPEGADYTVRPFKDSDPLNGVSTYDLVLISQHILGLRPFDTPYKYLAADINRSGSITAFDLVQMRQLILNITKKFPDNTSWRFVDMDYEFENDESAMNMNNQPEEKTINNLLGDRLGMDFLGVKIGDINGSAVPNRSSWASGRNAKDNFTLLIDNQNLEKGKVYTIPFYAKDFEQITGYQFTLDFQDLTLLNIQGGIASLENFGRSHEANGILTTSWHSLQSHERSSTLFTLTFQATMDGTLNEMLKITSTHTPAEAYRFSGEFLDVELEFREVSPIAFQVYQNTPNPFNDQTNISFDLPAKGNVVLQLVNSQGQIVKKQEAAYQRGLNTIELSLKNLPDGTYYYQLATPYGVETKKMSKVQ